MKKSILAVAITIASTQAFATGIDLTNPFNHVTQPQLVSEAKARSDADKNLQSQITQHGYEINTQAKYTTSVNEDLQASKAAVSSTLNSQQSQLNAVQDAAQQANVKADSAHVRLDSVETNLGNVQTAAQIANDRASSLETRADVSENAIRETNGAVSSINADLQSSKAAGVAIATGLNDKIENVANNAAIEIGKSNTAIKGVDDKLNTAIGVQGSINSAQAVVNSNQTNTNTYVQGQLSSVNTKAENAKSTANVALSVGAANTVSIAKNTTDISKNSSDIKTVSTRVTSAEQVNTRQDVQLASQGEAINRNTVQLGQHAQVLNEYGTRLDNQEAMSSRFAADLGNVKSQVNGMQSQLNSQGKRIGQVENGLAMVAATAAIQFNTDPEAGFQAGCGVAQIRSNTGSACAVGGAITKNWFVSGYVMQASSTSGVAASATYSWGR